MFNVLRFTKDGMYRELIITDDSENGDDTCYYMIIGKDNTLGKKHYDNPTIYISNMIRNGWKKVDFKDFLRTKYLYGLYGKYENAC